MDIGVVSKRYAKALLLFAKQFGEEDKVYEETSVLVRSFLALPQLRTQLLNPVMSNADKLKVLSVASCGQGTLSKSLQAFLTLVLKHCREGMIHFIAHAYIELYRQDKNLVHAQLVIPTQFTTQTVERLKHLLAQLTGKQIDFEVRIDDAIGGGFILEYDTYRLDVSNRTRLSQMRRQLQLVSA